MRFLTNKKIALSYKIYSLALLGIFGLVAGVAENIYIAKEVEQTQSLQKELVDVQLFVKDEAFLRSSYLRKLDDKIQKEIVELSQKTESGLADILKHDIEPEINSNIESLIESNKKKSEEFKLLGDVSKSLESNKLKVLELYGNRDKILQEVSTQIDQEETNSMMYGEDFKEVKKSLRIFAKDYISTSSTYFMAINDLIIFKDKAKYLSQMEQVKESVKLTHGNIVSLIGAINEKYYTDTWNQVLTYQKQIDELSIETVKIWEAQQKKVQEFSQIEDQMLAGLDKTSNLLVGHILKIKNILEVVIYVSVGVLVLVMGGLSVLIARPLVKSLNEMATSLGELSESVLNTSSDLKETSNDLSSASERQASSVQETVASLDEISAMVESNVENSDRSNKLTESLATAATQSKSTVEEVKNSINEVSNSNDAIMEQMNKTNEEMTRISQVISNIGEKTKVINDIVFQTKLLSFNASVEAARAGEHGKGFAVVAEEVGNLAQMSGTAADEISELLGQSIANVEQVVQDNKTRIEHLISTGKEKVESSVIASDMSVEALNKILSEVQNVKEMTAQVANASREQSVGINEINNAMGLIDQTTKENSVSAADSANYAENMNEKAVKLKSAVEELLVIVNGESHSHISSSEAHYEEKRDPREPEREIIGADHQIEFDDNDFEDIA